MSSTSKYKSIVPAVDQAIQVLHCLADPAIQQLTLTEICTRLGLHKSKAYTILNTLASYDFVEKNEQTKTYRLGLGLISLSHNVLNSIDIRDIVIPPLKELAEQTELTAHFGQIIGSKVYIIAKEESNKRFGYALRIGLRHNLTHGAHGKAIVAFMNEEEREKILQQENLEFFGIDQPVDLEYLREEFLETRKTGYAVDPRETNPDILCISSPVFEGSGIIKGCIILIGVFSRSRLKVFGPMVAQTALGISKNLGFHGTYLDI